MPHRSNNNMGSRRADQPPHPPTSSPASRTITRIRSQLGPGPDPGPVLKTILPHFDSRASGRLRQLRRLHLLARARPGQGITSVAVRKALVLRALKTKRARGLSTSAWRFCSILLFPALHILQSYCSAYRANGQAPSTALGSSCTLIQP